MMTGSTEKPIRSVAIIGAGAAGAVTAAAFKAEHYFDRIRVYERRETTGGVWIHDVGPRHPPQVQPGSVAFEIDPPLKVPDNLPQQTDPNHQERYSHTSLYENLTTNTPDIAMCFSDQRFAYGPFVPHYVTKQYIDNYFAQHKTDSFLVLNTTLEDLSKLPPSTPGGFNRWKLTLRKHDPVLDVDLWWEETYDAVVLATGHYSVPYVPYVPGLKEYTAKSPDRVIHSKWYRSPSLFTNKRVLIIGNSTSGHDISLDLLSSVKLPLSQSRRSSSRWDGNGPPQGIEWKPVITEYIPDSGRIVFADGSYLDDIDVVIYCTGYQPSFPFWNAENNGRELYDYRAGRLLRNYQHTFLQDFPSLGMVGLPRVLTFRSFEYQAIALARYWAGREWSELTPVWAQAKWEQARAEKTRRERRKFHDIPWDNGETEEWFGWLYRFAGLGSLSGDGRVPPVLGRDVVWAVENLKKYPEPGKGDEKSANAELDGTVEEDWVIVVREEKDSLAFI
ncbi:hypothetical protein QBC35DRAFT_509483 [Podospora australis]|uniref:Monooxygenase n=1 Tax=Podospora australis TaxID=1536484 RepID=A0AAN6WK19_9PEZI|nr:hypothetical protein QBC35DRAFT_509483 [Podospora australis]